MKISKFQFPGLNLPPAELPSAARVDNRMQQIPVAQPPVIKGSVLSDNQRSMYDLCDTDFHSFFSNFLLLKVRWHIA